MKFPPRALLPILLLALFGVLMWVLQPEEALPTSSSWKSQKVDSIQQASALEGAVLDAEKGERVLHPTRGELPAEENLAAANPEDEDEDWIQIHVMNDRGEPIPDAISFYEFLDSPTDENGNAEIYFPKDAETFWLTAQGYEILAVTRAGQVGRKWDITLLDAVRLHISWQLPPETEIGSLRLMLESDGEVFAPDAFANATVATKLRKALGLEVTNIGSGWSEEVTEYCNLYPGDEGIEVWGLMPRTSMNIALASPSGKAVVSSGPIVFAQGEERVIALNLKTRLKTLNLHVVDFEGNGLEGIGVHHGFTEGVTSGSYQYYLETDADGFVAIEGLLEPNVDLQVGPEGSFAAKVLQGFSIPFDEKPVEVVLQKNRKLRFFVRDATGTALRAYFWTHWGEVSFRNGSNPEFHTTASNAPLGEFQASWAVGGVVHHETIPAGVEELTFEAPALGSLKVTARTETADSAFLYEIVLQSAEVNTRPVSAWFGFHAGITELSRVIPHVGLGSHHLSVMRIHKRTGERETIFDYGEVEIVANHQTTVQVVW